mgnify:FL=1
MSIRFHLNGELNQECSISPSTTVLDYLRLIQMATGTKEGCAEGDCGACSIVLHSLDDNNKPKYEVVNSCLLLLSQIDGANLITVEGLGSNGVLDAVQEAMIEKGGTQCGFCTPGFVMSLYSLRQTSKKTLDDDIIHDALAGNLCRCTGYRPIVEAAYKACAFGPTDDFPDLEALEVTEHQYFEDELVFSPTSLDELLRLKINYPDGLLLAGGTDLGLRASKNRERFKVIIHTAHVIELTKIEETDDSLEIGAAVTYSESLENITRAYPSFGRLITRIGSRQIRNMGTIGGNIGTASPIGDTLPCLVSLNASFEIVSEGSSRIERAEDFFIDYRETSLGPTEIIKKIKLPKLQKNQQFRVYKISKRYDQDISSVVAAFLVEIENDVVVDFRATFGGMAAIPKRASECEKVLLGKEWSEENMLMVGKAVEKDFVPLSDHRASSNYRLKVAANLFLRLYRDLSDQGDLLEVVAV